MNCSNLIFVFFKSNHWFPTRELSDEYSPDKFKVLSCKIDRHKTNTVVDNTVLFYPDISDIAKDVYFALAYYLVLENGQGASEFTFDGLAKRVYEHDYKVSSKVSKEWQTLYKQVVLDTYDTKYKDLFENSDDDRKVSQ